MEIGKLKADDFVAFLTMILWYPTLAFIGVFIAALLCLPLTRRMPWRYLLATAVYLSADAALLRLAPHVHGLRWNWSGKAASLLLGLVAMHLGRLSRVDVGLTLPQRKSWPLILAGLALAVTWSVIAGQSVYSRPFDPETLAFQATMPGLAEELAYRGIAYGLLLRGFRERSSRRSTFAAIFITSFCFGLGHIEPVFVGLPEAFPIVIHYGLLQFGSEFLIGTLLAALRCCSGSLLSSMLAHGVANVAGTLTANH